jgi:Spy/CpxP family protein refolding chaperone
MACLVVGVAAVSVAAPLAPEASWSRFPLMNTPVARMISGCVGRLMVLRSEMNVSGQQQAAIREVLVARRPQIAQTVRSVREKRLVLRNAVLSGEADEAQIRAAAEELGQAIGDAAVKATRLRNEIAPILSSEQRELIREFLEENDAAVDKFLAQAAEGK